MLACIVIDVLGCHLFQPVVRRMRRLQAMLRSMAQTPDDDFSTLPSMLSIHRFSMMNLHQAGVAVPAQHAHPASTRGSGRPMFPLRRSASAGDSSAFVTAGSTDDHSAAAARDAAACVGGVPSAISTGAATGTVSDGRRQLKQQQLMTGNAGGRAIIPTEDWYASTDRPSHEAVEEAIQKKVSVKSASGYTTP